MTRPAHAPPRAEHRTLSLFTGLSDLEDPVRARDGTTPTPKPTPTRPAPRRWKKETHLGADTPTTWSSNRGEAIWRDGDGFRCRNKAGEHGPFATMAEAARVAESGT